MQYKDSLWEMIIGNISFFSDFSTFSQYDIDGQNKMFTANGVKYSDPMSLLLFLYRDKFNTMSFSSDPEFIRIRKHLYSNDINIPISKKDYDEYHDLINLSIDTEVAFSDIGGMDDEYILKIPSKAKVKSEYSDAISAIESIFPRFFSYAGHIARCSKDINGIVSALDIFAENDSYHMESTNDVETAFNEFNMIDNMEELNVLEISESSKLKKDTIFISHSTTGSIKKFIGLYKSINIKIDSKALIYDIVHSNSDVIGSTSIKINDEIAVGYILNEIEEASKILDYSSKYNAIIETAKIGSILSEKEKKFIMNGLSSKIDDKLLNAVEYILDEDNTDISNKIHKFMLDKGVFPVSKNYSSSPELVFYVKSLKKTIVVPIDRSNILSIIIPELGGIRLIIKKLSIEDPSGPGNSENAVLTRILYFMQEIYRSVPYHNGDKQFGIFLYDEIISNISKSTEGIVSNGNVFVNSGKNIHIPKKKTIQKSAVSSIESFKDFASESIDNINTASIIMYSSILNHIIKPMYALNILFNTNDNISFEMIKRGLLSSNFGYYNDMCLSDSKSIVKKIYSSTAPTLISGASTEILEIAESPYNSLISVRNRYGNDSTIQNNIGSIFVYGSSHMKYNSFAKISIKTSQSILDNIYESSKNEKTGNILTYISGNYEKAIDISNRIRKEFSSDIKGTILSSNALAYAEMEKLLPSMVMIEMLYGKTDYKIHLRQIIANHMNKISLTKTGILEYANKSGSRIGIMSSAEKKLILYSFCIDEAVNDIKMFCITPVDIISFIEKEFRTISGDTAHNYKLENGGIYNVNKKKNIVEFVV